MTHLLEKVFTMVKELPDDEQDAIASIILDEILEDQKWNEKFAETQSELEKLADRARVAIRAGQVRKMGFDEL
jgi:hypothetical protein